MDNYASVLGTILARGWWLLLQRGLAASVFGILTIFKPQIALAVIWLLGASAMLVGGLRVILALKLHQFMRNPERTV